MRIKDLPGDTNIKGLKVKIPDDVYNNNPTMALMRPPTQEVYLVGYMMGDFFVSCEPPIEEGDVKIYPLMGLETSILDWEVIEKP